METPPASDFTVGIIYVKPLELMAVVPMLDHKYPPISAVNNLPYVYTLGQIGHHNVAIAGPARGQQGTVAIAHLAATLRSTFPNMTMGLLVGIGGGIPHLPENDVRLGDVVVSAPESGPHVVQYDLGKKTTNGFETSRFLAAPPSLLLQVVNHVEESMSSRADHEEPTLARHLRRISGSTLLSREYCKPMAPDRLFWADYLHQEGTDCLQHPEDDEIYREARPEEGDIVVHYSTILSGDSVMKCATERDALSRRYNNALCIEMEAAGAMDVFPCLVIRGISDYADSHKNSAWQKHAALAAAAYMRELLLQLPGTQPTKTLTQSHIGHGQCELIWRFPANELHHIQRALLQDSQEEPRRVMDHPPHSTWNIAASQKPALYVPEGMEFLANDLEDPHQALLPMTPQPQFAALPAVGPSSNSLWNILYPPDNVADMLPMRGIQEFARDNLPRVESCSSEPTQREWPVYCMEGLQVIGQIDISDSQSKRFFAEEQLQVVSVTMGINLRAQTHPFGVEEEGLTAYASVVTSDQELLQPTTSIMVRCNIHRGDHWGVELERLKSTAICKGLARLYNPLVKKRYALDFVTPILLAQGRDSIESTSLEDWGVGRPPPLLRLEPTLTEAWTRYTDNHVGVFDTANHLVSRAAQAFSHFTFEVTGGLLMVVDLQGVDGLLAWPAIHTRDPHRLNRDGRNLHTAGMDGFFSTHKCNSICTTLKLRKRTDGQQKSSHVPSTIRSSLRPQSALCNNPLCLSILRAVPEERSVLEQNGTRLCAVCESKTINVSDHVEFVDSEP